jgi:hypothetical protein
VRRSNCGGALVEEGADAFLEVGTSEALGHQSLRLGLGGAEAPLGVLVDLALHHGERRRRARARQLLDVAAAERQQLVPLDEVVAQPEPESLVTADTTGGEQQVERHRRPDQLREQPPETPLGDQAALGERRQEQALGAQHPEVARERERERHPRHGAVHGGDDRLGDGHQVTEPAGEVALDVDPGAGGWRLGDVAAGVGGGRCRVGGRQTVEQLHVGAGAEGPAGAGDHDPDDRGVGHGTTDRLADLDVHPAGPRVQ